MLKHSLRISVSARLFGIQEYILDLNVALSVPIVADNLTDTLYSYTHKKNIMKP